MKQTMLLLFLLLILVIHCDTTEPPTSKASLTLELEDVSCTEAWIKLTTTNLPLPTSITLKQKDAVRATINLTTPDTLLYVDSLLPKQTYVFQVTSILNPASSLSSNKATATTLDTTSHNFTWQTWVFGQHSSSVLYDVAIINENNIWAVGEIYMKDSLGNPDPTFYNAVHWNGTDWELKKIFYKGGMWAIRTIFAFNENDIWFSGYMRYLNGQFIELPIPSILMGWQINKLWGVSSNDLYAVGNGGNIAHYQNGVWKKIESGTTLSIYDIWGAINNKTNQAEILCVASNIFNNQGEKVLKISSNKITEINSQGLPWAINTVWFIQDRKYFIGGDGLYTTKSLGEEWQQLTLPPYYKNCIRGNSLNNILVSGSYGLLLHFNGMTWHHFQDEIPINGSYGKIAITEEFVCCSGGLNNGKAIILIGRK